MLVLLRVRIWDPASLVEGLAKVNLPKSLRFEIVFPPFALYICCYPQILCLDSFVCVKPLVSVIRLAAPLCSAVCCVQDNPRVSLFTDFLSANGQTTST